MKKKKKCDSFSFLIKVILIKFGLIPGAYLRNLTALYRISKKVCKANIKERRIKDVSKKRCDIKFPNLYSQPYLTFSIFKYIHSLPNVKDGEENANFRKPITIEEDAIHCRSR